VGNGAPPEFNQSNSYDFAGRLKYNGAGPLGQWLKYDAFNNLTERQNSFYEYEDRFEAVYANNRKAYGIGGGYDYHDNAGNVVHSHFQPYVGIGNRPFIDDKKWTFDAAGRMSYFTQFTTADVPYTSARETKSTLSFDGDGRLVKDDNYFRDCGVAEEPDECTGEWLGGATHYLVSSVTGQKITMVGDGENGGQSVFLGATKVAAYFESNQPNFTLTDPITGSTAPMGSDGTVHDHVRTELAAFGTAVPLYAPPSFPGGEVFEGTGNPGDSEWGCKDEFGDPEPCSFWNIYHHSNQVDAAKKRRIYKEPMGIVDPRRLPTLPYDENPRGPATGLAAGYANSTAFAMPDIHLPEETVIVNMSNPFESMSAESGMPLAPPRWTVSDLAGATRKVIDNALKNDPKGDCAKLFAKDALAEFDKIVKDIDYHPNTLIGRRDDSAREQTLGERPEVSAVTNGKDIDLNLNGYAFANYSGIGTPKSIRDSVNKLYSEFGASNQWGFAIGIIIHEFLHTTGKFGIDSTIGLDGKVDSKKSQKYQKEVLKKCKTQIAKIAEPGG